MNQANKKVLMLYALICLLDFFWWGSSQVYSYATGGYGYDNIFGYIFFIIISFTFVFPWNKATSDDKKRYIYIIAVIVFAVIGYLFDIISEEVGIMIR